MLQLINDILDLAKIEAGKMELDLETFSLRETIQEVCAVMKPLAAQRNIALTVIPAKTDQITFHPAENLNKFSSTYYPMR